MKQLGPVGDVLAGTPGIGDRITAGEDTEQSLRRVQGMIGAMTKEERDSPDILDDPRRRRIAAGAGVRPQDIERFLGQFQRVRVLIRQMAQMSIWREGGASPNAALTGAAMSVSEGWSLPRRPQL